MKILITGGAGNLACQLTHLLPPEAELLLMDIAEKPVAPVRSDIRFIQGDLTDTTAMESLFQLEKPDQVIHLASLLSGSTEENRPLGWKINATAGFELLDLCLRHQVKRVLFPSSLAVWGGSLPDPLPENHETWPDGLYGVTKVAVERLGHYYFRKHGLDFRAVRLPIIISPYAPQGAASAYASHAFVQGVQEGRFRFKVTPETRVSMMYVKDALRVLTGLLNADPARLSRRVYNVQAISPNGQELAEAVRLRLPNADIDFDPDPEVAALIDSWPGVIKDAASTLDWDWTPKWTLDRLADDMVESLQHVKN